MRTYTRINHSHIQHIHTSIESNDFSWHWVNKRNEIDTVCFKTKRKKKCEQYVFIHIVWCKKTSIPHPWSISIYVVLEFLKIFFNRTVFTNEHVELRPHTITRMRCVWRQRQRYMAIYLYTPITTQWLRILYVLCMILCWLSLCVVFN